MNRPSGNGTVLALLAVDLLGIFILFNLAHWLVRDLIAEDLLLSWKLLLVANVWFLYFYLMDLYTFESTLSQLGMLERSAIATLLTGITVALIVYTLGPSFIGGFVGRGVLTVSLAGVWLWCLGARYSLKPLLASRERGTQWLILADSHLDTFVAQFRAVYRREQLLILCEPEIGTPPDIHSRRIGTWDDIKGAAAADIAGIIISSQRPLPDHLVSALMQIRIRGTRIYSINDFYERYLSCLPVFHMDQNWLAMAHGFDLIHNPFGLRFKRYVDILIALVGGVIAVPLATTVALAVLLTSGSPVLYGQTRTGENGRPFRVYKFRTMRNDAETAGPQYATNNDPRLTPIGQMLRKFRLDEMPQLWNVLRGDMSLIGPRPERPEFVADLQREIPYYNLSHLIRPGITGWAQVMYGYGDSAEDASTKLQYDLFYIKNYSLMLDISILVRSIKIVLFGTGR
jgi:exopolysaccharide biosynthesis polyprenyl glycosylphosphotransferase